MTTSASAFVRMPLALAHPCGEEPARENRRQVAGPPRDPGCPFGHHPEQVVEATRDGSIEVERRAVEDDPVEAQEGGELVGESAVSKFGGM